MKTVIGKNIQRAMLDQKHTQKTLAKASGVSQVTIHKLISGKAKESAKLPAIAKALGTTAEWLSESHAENLNTLKIEESKPTYSTGVKAVPLISCVRAGHWLEASDPYAPGHAEEWRETTAKVGPRAFALKVVGDSMQNPTGSPSIPEGSIVIVDPDREATSGKIVVAKLLESDEVTLKKLVVDGPNVYLKPLNPDYKTIQVDGKLKVIGVVVKYEFDL